MPRAGVEPTISADERTQDYALDRAVPGTGDAKLKEQKSNANLMNKNYKFDKKKL